MNLGLAQLVDAVIVFALLECIVLTVHHRSTGRGVPLRDFLANMVSGLCLMLALRCVVRDAGTAWIALCLLAAGVAHGTDLWMRWRHAVRPASANRRLVA
jgi:hypothetical protein